MRRQPTHPKQVTLEQKTAIPDHEPTTAFLSSRRPAAQKFSSQPATYLSAYQPSLAVVPGNAQADMKLPSEPRSAAVPRRIEPEPIPATSGTRNPDCTPAKLVTKTGEEPTFGKYPFNFYQKNGGIHTVRSQKDIEAIVKEGLSTLQASRR